MSLSMPQCCAPRAAFVDEGFILNKKNNEYFLLH